LSIISQCFTADSCFWQEIIALARPASLSNPANVAIRERGVELRALDLSSSEDSIVDALAGIDILISAIGPRAQLAQIPLAFAAKKAGIKRFVPCAWAPIVPVGVHRSRDQKEEVFNLVKRLHVPYTIIDIGWWYQFTLPRLPSGKIDYALTVPMKTIPGDGHTLTALTDVRDVGKYVARVIKDERTLNAMVFVYNELWSMSRVYDLLEKMSGESVKREFTSTQEFEQQIADADVRLNKDPDDVAARQQKVIAQYYLSTFIRGENTPEFARYLGYLDGKQLYPDVKFNTFESYVEEVLNGTAKAAYQDR
jgi:hypothetical protein